jgi:hypothetical protein
MWLPICGRITCGSICACQIGDVTVMLSILSAWPGQLVLVLLVLLSWCSGPMRVG